MNCGVDCTALIRFGMMWEFGTDSRSFCCAGRNLFVAGAFDTDSLFTLWDALVGPVFVFFAHGTPGVIEGIPHSTTMQSNKTTFNETETWSANEAPSGEGQ